jgi:hypothetical protein
MRFEHTCEGFTGELAPLIGVENLRNTFDLQSFL